MRGVSSQSRAQSSPKQKGISHEEFCVLFCLVTDYYGDLKSP